MNVKIIVGANYGDEGKGLATNYFSKAANGKVLNVLYSSGPQRGHTVELSDGTRHVFHHLGSGSFSGADTFFDERFLINPMVFVKEWNELSLDTKCYIHPWCRVTTPYDMFVNQIVEISRGGNRHGSCGYGCWETIKRYDKAVSPDYKAYFLHMNAMSRPQLYKYLDQIRKDYLPWCLDFYGVYDLKNFDAEHNTNFSDLVNDDRIVWHYIDDFQLMKSITETYATNAMISQYDLLVYEGSQGLAINGTNKEAFPHITVDDIGGSIPVKLLSEHDCDIELCYVTRPYFTRHGAGPFETECAKEAINAEIVDQTNVANEFQGEFRFGYFDVLEFQKRVATDINKCLIQNCKNKLTSSVFVTQLNYTNNNIRCKNIDINLETFKNLCSQFVSKLYSSDTIDSKNVKEEYIP